MDRPRLRPHPRQRRWPTAATPWLFGLGVGLTTMLALGSWLLLSDPVVAADVAATGDLMPLLEAVFATLRAALADLLSYL